MNTIPIYTDWKTELQRLALRRGVNPTFVEEPVWEWYHKTGHTPEYALNNEFPGSDE